MTEERDISAAGVSAEWLSSDCLSALYQRVDPSYFAGMDGIWEPAGKPAAGPYVRFRDLNGENDQFDWEDRRKKPSAEAGLKLEF